jgi:hypothetical protein
MSPKPSQIVAWLVAVGQQEMSSRDDGEGVFRGSTVEAVMEAGRNEPAELVAEAISYLSGAEA